MAGRRSLQKVHRQDLAKEFSARLIDRLNIEDVERSGRVVPRGSLKRRCVRNLFNFIPGRFSGRVFTKKLCRLIVRDLVRRLDFVPIRDPLESFGTWVNREAGRLQQIAQRAKKLLSAP